jgi:hypothetical protein
VHRILLVDKPAAKFETALKRSRSDQEFLKWVKELCEANLVYHALGVTPRIAARNLISDTETRRELFQSISPEVLRFIFNLHGLHSLKSRDWRTPKNSRD